MLLRWTRVNTGRKIAAMRFQSELTEDSGYVDLYWTSTDRQTGETRQCEDSISLTTNSQPFGGQRWFFVCPRTGESVAKLHLPSGADNFASRKAHRLGYRSQRESPRNRSLSRAFARKPPELLPLSLDAINGRSRRIVLKNSDFRLDHICRGQGGTLKNFGGTRP